MAGEREEPAGTAPGKSRRDEAAQGRGGGEATGQAPASGHDTGTGAGTGSSPAETAAPRTPFTQQVGRVALAVVAVLFGVFAVFNAQSVDFDWIFGETLVEDDGGVPLIVLLLVSFAIGAAVGAFAAWRRGRRQRRTERAAGRESASGESRAGRERDPADGTGDAGGAPDGTG